MVITYTFELTRLAVQLKSLFRRITDGTNTKACLFLIQNNGVLSFFFIYLSVDLCTRSI